MSSALAITPATRQTRQTFVACAEAIAREASADAVYAAGAVPQSYSVHLEAVVRILEEAGVGAGAASPTDAETLVLAAAWCHDLLEDTPLDAEALAAAQRAALTQAGAVDAGAPLLAPWVTIVERLTTQEDGRSRAERMQDALLRISACPLATAVKLADRIANLRASVATAATPAGQRHLQRYLGEVRMMSATLGATPAVLTHVHARLWGTLRATIVAGQAVAVPRGIVGRPGR